VFFSPDVLLGRVCGRCLEDFVYVDSVCGDRAFSDFRFFRSWASSCIDIDNSAVVVMSLLKSILYVT
jgi:hypothetical protein